MDLIWFGNGGYIFQFVVIWLFFVKKDFVTRIDKKDSIAISKLNFEKFFSLFIISPNTRWVVECHMKRFRTENRWKPVTQINLKKKYYFF